MQTFIGCRSHVTQQNESTRNPRADIPRACRIQPKAPLEIIPEIQSAQEEIKALRRWFHAHLGLAFEETQTSDAKHNERTVVSRPGSKVSERLTSSPAAAVLDALK
ncbi:hypothetical protein [Bradyrhizobium niftali]|uniref:Uncharacterized protein n=1 Tax=Bradyrhizobium niftali TaxID=2560055 RepID=A0A4Y9L164_9BRAD|nr:hypothetical protein [Bradyrhizobium niftali]TFV37341.1 hypothetical protein E4K65_43995 [Bradyrhizobium niftali]